jgi:hypothetical protein
MKRTQENRIHTHDGEKLRQIWIAQGNQYCRHRHFGIESTESGYATGFYVCKRCGARMHHGDSPVNKYRISATRLAAAFLGGAFMGVIVTVLTTPERGAVVRRRFSRAIGSLRTDVPHLMSDSCEAYGALAKDARQTFRQTVSRLTMVMTTCFKSVKKNATRS